VVSGSLPADTEGCFWQGVKSLFGGGEQPAAAGSAQPNAPNPSTTDTPIRN